MKKIKAIVVGFVGFGNYLRARYGAQEGDLFLFPVTSTDDFVKGLSNPNHERFSEQTRTVLKLANASNQLLCSDNWNPTALTEFFKKNELPKIDLSNLDPQQKLSSSDIEKLLLQAYPDLRIYGPTYHNRIRNQ